MQSELDDTSAENLRLKANVKALTVELEKKDQLLKLVTTDNYEFKKTIDRLTTNLSEKAKSLHTVESTLRLSKRRAEAVQQARRENAWPRELRLVLGGEQDNLEKQEEHAVKLGGKPLIVVVMAILLSCVDETDQLHIQRARDVAITFISANRELRQAVVAAYKNVREQASRQFVSCLNDVPARLRGRYVWDSVLGIKDTLATTETEPIAEEQQPWDARHSALALLRQMLSFRIRMAQQSPASNAKKGYMHSLQAHSGPRGSTRIE